MSNLVDFPLIESVKRTYLYMFANAKKAIAICSFWYVLTVCICLSMAGFSGGIAVSILVDIISSAAISVSFVRLIILNEENKPFQKTFGKREMKYMLYELLLTFMILLAVSVILVSLSPSDNAGIGSSPSSMLAFAITALAATAYLSRSFLLLPAIAVENKELKFSDAFKMSKGNTSKFFAGMLLACIPAFILLNILAEIIRQLNLNIGLLLVMILIIRAVMMFYSLIKACYLAHAYQYFVYFYTQQEQEPEGVDK